MKRTYLIAGGDARQKAIAHRLEERGDRIYSFGFTGQDRLTAEAATRFGTADVVLFPLPAVDSTGCLNAPTLEKKLPVEIFWPLLRPAQTILGGMWTENSMCAARACGLHPIDYYHREELILKNAYITAEGAVQLTLQSRDEILKGTHCLVLGYGRIGKALARLLLGMGAHVTVAARKTADLVQASFAGCETCPLTCMDNCLRRCGIVYNTIPHLVLDRVRLQCLDKDCLCIDLASKPGGVDFGAAKTLGIRAVWALGLPGKTAPTTAGLAILNTIDEILAEQEAEI